MDKQPANSSAKSDAPFPWTRILSARQKKAALPKRKGVKEWFHQLRYAGAAKHVELGMAFAIVFFSLIQIAITISNNNETGRQVSDLIAASRYGAFAAKQNAQAARDFSGSARNINNGVGDAVDRLNIQAQETQILAEQAVEQARAARELAPNTQSLVAAAKESSALDQRAWVSVEIVPKINRQTTPETPGIEPVIRNTGKTPALRYTVECCEAFVQVYPEQYPDYDYLHVKTASAERSKVDDRNAKWIASVPLKDRAAFADNVNKAEATFRADSQQFESGGASEQVLAPGATRPLGDWFLSSGKNGALTLWVGKIVYSIVTDSTQRHTTKFCLSQIGNSPLQLCKKGQDME